MTITTQFLIALGIGLIVAPALLVLGATMIAMGLAVGVFIGYVAIIVILIAAVVCAVVFPIMFAYKWLFT